MPGRGRKFGGALGGLLGLVAFSAAAGVLLTVAVAPAIALTGISTSTAVDVFNSIPADITIDRQTERSTIYAKQGGQDVPIATVYDGEQDREQVTWEQVADSAKHALVSGEDRRFYDHGGVDLQRVGTAVFSNLQNGEITSGASTLTMQLVKNLLVSDALALPVGDDRDTAILAAREESFDRKLREMRMAIQLEKEYTKDEILLAYLNVANFGGSTYGIQAAAQRYFSTDAASLTNAQAASLIAIVQEPGRRNLAVVDNYSWNQERRDEILGRMFQDQYMTQQEYDEAIATPVDETTVFLQQPTNGCYWANDIAKHWCDYVTHVMRSDVDALGSNAVDREANWDKGGYDIYTSLNLDLQQVVSDTLEARTPADNPRLQGLGSAVTSVEVGTGWIVTMDQNKIFDNTIEGDSNPAAESLNYAVDQAYGGGEGFRPASTMKTYTLLAWLKAGRGLGETVQVNEKERWETEFTNSCTPTTRGVEKWDLQNDSNEGGTRSVSQATVGSINNAYAEMAEQLDLCEIAEIAESLGVHNATGADIDSTLPSFILGSGANQSSPLTMAASYAAIANGGVYCEPIAITRVVDAVGVELGGQTPSCRDSAIDAEIAAEGMAQLERNAQSYASWPRDGVDFFAKTGSDDNYWQTWLVGSTSKVATATWIGQGGAERDRVNLQRWGYSQTRHLVARPILQAINQVYGGDPFPSVDPAIWGRGTRQPEVPAVVVGQTVDQARTALDVYDLNIADGGEEDGNLPAGQIVRTVPAVGTPVNPNTSVTVYRSNGRYALVPDVATPKLLRDQAVAEIEGAGLTPVEQCVPPISGQLDMTDRVTDQSVQAGAQVDRGSEVVISVVRAECDTDGAANAG